MAEKEQGERQDEQQLELNTELGSESTAAEGAESEASPPDPVAALRREFEDRLAKEREERARIEGELRAMRESRPAEAKPAPQTFTRAQLRQAVDEGRITEDDMFETLERQGREQLIREMDDRYAARERERTTRQTIESERKKYVDAYPGLLEQGSEAWNRAKREFDHLVSLGHDPNAELTEITALRAAFGTASRAVERTSSERPTSRETSGARGSDSGARPVDIINRVPQKYREQYRKWYADGVKSAADIEAELPYMQRQS